MALAFGAAIASAAAPADKTYTLSRETAAKISAAAPTEPVARPQKPHRVLVYGRMPTHPESVVCCFYAMEQIAEKSGAFEVVSSGDPAVFLPESLARFDAVVMNNTHERYPMRPANFNDLDPQAKKAAEEQEVVLKKSLMDFVTGGKGIVGIHGAVAGGVQWPEYLEMLNGSYGGHFSQTVAVGPVMPDHPICKPLGGKTFEVYDELYMFKAPYDPKKVEILLALDLTKMADPGRRPDKDYPVSWIRSYGKASLLLLPGHLRRPIPAGSNEALLAGSVAIGDLE